MGNDIQINCGTLVVLGEEYFVQEQIGTKEKYWVRGNRYLFKRGRPRTGEDWAEVFVSEFCEVLGIPHAKYCFARDWTGKYGVLTESFVPECGSLILGNELIKKYFIGYDATKRYKHTGHTLSRVLTLIHYATENYGLLPPAVCPGPVHKPIDVFTSYLLVDALVGNQDRHHENWGFISCPEELYLAHTFDHASSLGRNDKSEKKMCLLEGRDKRVSMESFCCKAKSPFYLKTDSRPLSTLDAFCVAASFNGRKFDLMPFLDGFTTDGLYDIFSQFPRDLPNGPNEIDKKFAIAMVNTNKDRLLRKFKV